MGLVEQHMQVTCTKENVTADTSRSVAVLAILARRKAFQEVAEEAGRAKPHAGTNGNVETQPIRKALMAT